MKFKIAVMFLSLIFIVLTRSELIQAAQENNLFYPLAQNNTDQEKSPYN